MTISSSNSSRLRRQVARALVPGVRVVRADAAVVA
jgi:hypothetical protein